MIKKLFAGILLVSIYCSCKESQKDLIIHLVNEWKDKTIIFPSSSSFISYTENATQKQDIPNREYTIITYVDSIGCISCKLQLPRWKEIIHVFDSISKKQVSFLFYFHPRDKRELTNLLKRNSFTYPVCIDSNDSLNKLNNFPSDMMFQTFLLDKNRKVIAIGNPVNNPNIKELYLNIISGKTENTELEKQPFTTALLPGENFNFGSFSWTEKQEIKVILSNTGNIPLVINDIITSCGCTTVEYSKEPIQPGKTLTLKIKYKADHPEHFNKTVTVYSNAKESPFQLKISGTAK